MGEERVELTGRGLLRWAIVGAVILLGIGLYFAVGRRVPAVVQTPITENAS